MASFDIVFQHLPQFGRCAHFVRQTLQVSLRLCQIVLGVGESVRAIHKLCPMFFVSVMTLPARFAKQLQLFSRVLQSSASLQIFFQRRLQRLTSDFEVSELILEVGAFLLLTLVLHAQCCKMLILPTQLVFSPRQRVLRNLKTFSVKCDFLQSATHLLMLRLCSTLCHKPASHSLLQAVLQTPQLNVTAMFSVPPHNKVVLDCRKLAFEVLDFTTEAATEPFRLLLTGTALDNNLRRFQFASLFALEPNAELLALVFQRP
mmetsp:Transcript_35430/g.94311  ORF Transcript_35430/g.94311 Transcript_35430/m.94311 type:complete len:260 (+) Transcript_35430:859-1638(+)